MPELTLEWQEAGRKKTQTISAGQPSKNPGTVRIGRDPARCDITIANPTVSGLHVEIFFSFEQEQFFLRNLREINPPVVDGRRIIQGEIVLKSDSTIYLGQIIVKVVSYVVDISPTVFSLPEPFESMSLSLEEPTPKKPSRSTPTYQLKCPSCGRLCYYEWIDIGCRWCGSSLAAAASVFIQPEEEST